MTTKLSQLPAPDVIQQLDANSIHSQMVARYEQLMADQGADVSLKIGDPIYNAMLSMASEETTLRAEMQDISLQNMLAYATENNLDNLAALSSTERAEGESNDRLRERSQLAPEGFSVAGPDGAYKVHTLDADARVKHVDVSSPTKGQVLLQILSSEEGGTAAPDLISTVFAYMNASERRPLTDEVVVQSAAIGNFTVEADLYFASGPSRELVLAAVTAAVQAYVDQQHRIGAEVALSGLMAALHQPGVEKAVLNTPAAGVAAVAGTAPFCTEITLAWAN